MLRFGSLVAAVVALAICGAYAGEKRRLAPEQRLHKLELRARRIPVVTNGDQPGQFLISETRRLINRSRSVPAGSYEFERLLEALDDLLDAREDLAEARRGNGLESKRRDGKPEKEDTRTATARRLERAYFRAQQAEYFGRLSGEQQASEYTLRSRQLYQQARAAYDLREYERATKLASASSEMVNVIENLAQAAVRRPDPPVLK
jgi:hypothetical protein